MRIYQATPSTSIPHDSYQFDGYGNTLYRSSDALRVARIEEHMMKLDLLPGDADYAMYLGDALQEAHPSWVDLDESVGSESLLVKVNLELLQFFTYDRGRLALTHCERPTAFARRLAYERNHYEVAQPPYLLFIQEGKEVVIDTRKGICISGLGV